MINGLRYLISQFFKNRSVTQIDRETFNGLFQMNANTLAEQQTKVRGMLLNLLGRQRIRRQWLFNQLPDFTPFNFRWNLYQDTSVLTLTKYREFVFRKFNTFVRNDIQSRLFIWTPINEPILQNEDNDTWENIIMENLELIEKNIKR